MDANELIILITCVASVLGFGVSIWSFRRIGRLMRGEPEREPIIRSRGFWSRVWSR